MRRAGRAPAGRNAGRGEVRRGAEPSRAGGAAAAVSRRHATQQLRALAHPLRLRLVEAFAVGRRTTMQVATELGEPPTRLYHHVNALERSGILKLVSTRQVRGTTEKYFELARKRIGGIRKEHLTPATRASLTGIATTVFEEARSELQAAMANPSSLTRETSPIALRMLLTVRPSRLPRVRKRLLAALKAILDECRKDKANPPGGERWALTVAFARRVTRGN